MKEHRKKIGEILVEAGLIDEMQLNIALGEQKKWDGRLCSIIVNMGFADEESIAAALEKQLQQKSVTFDDIEIPPDVLSLVKLKIARKYNIIPIGFVDNSLTIAMSDPLDLNTIDELSFQIGLRIRPVLAIDSCIKDAIGKYYEGITKKNIRSKIKTDNELGDIEIKETGFNTTHIHLSEGVFTEKEDKINPGVMVEALVRILIEKGLITKEELMKNIKEKSGPES